MVRQYKKKTERGTTPLMVMEEAARRVIDEKRSLRTVATEFDINFMTLQRFCAKTRSGGQPSVGYATPRAVFRNDQEQLLVKYIKRASELYYCLTPDDVRKLAYEYASINSVQVPQNWVTNKKAGADWFTSFSQRHSSLSIRTPEEVPSLPTGIETTPEMIRPFNEAAPRQKKIGGRKRPRSSISTSTPERHRLQEEHLAKEAKNPKIDIKFNITKKATKRNLAFTDETNTDASDNHCLLCYDTYDNSRSEEVWVKCTGCQKWAHEACTDRSIPYVCDFCKD